jgi:hypothetical protein
MKNFFIIFVFFWFENCFAKTDLTREPKAKGKDVVDAVINLIQESKMFPDDHQLIRRVACHESHFGNLKGTFDPKEGKPYYGGIWQIDNIGFVETQNIKSHNSLKAIHSEIKKKFNIDWMSLEWKDMLRPLYSGLAARILFYLTPEKIPDTLEEQAAYWKKYYNKNGAGTAEKFINSVKSKECSVECRGRMDLCIVLDGSGSIGSSDFKKAKEFVANLIGTFSLENVNVGLIVYSSWVSKIFTLNNNLSMAEIKSAVMDAEYPGSSTNTNDAIIAAVSMHRDAQYRDGVPRVITVYTDGYSDSGVKGGVAKAIRNNISNFAVGIGSNINENELEEIAYNDSSHVFKLSSYAALSEFFLAMNSETCKEPQKPLIGSKVTDTLVQNEKRYFSFELPEEGITISIDVTSGKTDAFYSYSVKTPSSALNDGTISDPTFISLPKTSNRKNSVVENQVFIAVEGIAESNNYTILGEEGDKSFSSKIEPLSKLFLFSILCIVLFEYFH